MIGTLFVVATPIGHLGDLSDRARDVLGRVAVVAAEDTRRSRVILARVDAHPRVMSYHAHSPPARLEALLAVLARGEDLALLSDAGTPTVSDPGAELVRRAREAGASVVAVPGPSAVTAALSVSGLPADRYLFLGFLPRRGRERRRLLEQAATCPWTVVLFEAANRLGALLADLDRHCGGDRPVSVARELTKVHEELKSGTVSELAGYYEGRVPRGEVTVLVSGAPAAPAQPVDGEAVRRRVAALREAGVSRRDAAQSVASEFGIPRKDAYRLVTDS